jgi:hypothetical protein
MIGVILHVMSRAVQQNRLGVGGVVICGIVLTQFAPLLTAAIQTFDEQLFMRGIAWFYDNGYGLPSVVLNHPWLITLVVYAAIAWTVGRFAGHTHAVVVVAFAASVLAGGMMKPLTGFGVTYPMLQFRFHFDFHPIPVGRILTQHFMVNGHADFMNVFVFNVVIVPLVALIAGLVARRHGSDAKGVAA